MIVVEDVETGKNLGLADDNVVPVGQKFAVGEAVKSIIDNFCTSSFTDTIERASNATFASGRGVKTILTREDLAISAIAKDSVDVGDSLAVPAVSNVIPERRSNGATTTYSPALRTSTQVYGETGTYNSPRRRKC